MSNTNNLIRIPRTYNFVRNKTDSYLQIQQHVKGLYPDVTDEFAGKIAEQYIRRKLKDDHQGLRDTITTVDSRFLKESGAAVLSSNNNENSQRNINLSDEPLNDNNSKHTHTKPETGSGNTKDKSPLTNCSDVPQKNRNKPHMSSIKDNSSTNKAQATAIRILPSEISYEDFLSLTNVQEGIKKDIMKKYPKEYEKYLNRVDKYIKRYYENDFLYESQWPHKIKFHDGSIRTLDDLNRVKSERLQTEGVLLEEIGKDAPANITQEIDSTEMVNEINRSPDLLPSSGESKDGNNRSLGACNANTSKKIHAVEFDVSQGIDSNAAKVKEIRSNLDDHPEVKNSPQYSEVLEPSLPDVPKEESENESSYANNTKFNICPQLPCDEQITILPRELSFDDFKNFTDIESYARNYIIGKFPTSAEKYLLRVDQFIKKLIEQTSIHCEKWPKIIKFNNPLIRTIEDLNRIKETAHNQTENRNLSQEEMITDEPYDCEEFEETARFMSLSKEDEFTNPFQHSMKESSRSVDRTQKNSLVETDEHISLLDVSLVGNNECNPSNSFLKTLNDVTFCDVANISSSDPSQKVNSQDVDPLTLKSENFNMMNISSSSSSLKSTETVILKKVAKYAPVFEERKPNKRHSAVQAVPENDVSQENTQFAAISHQQIHSNSTANKNTASSDYIPSLDSTNMSLQSTNDSTVEMITNEELTVLRELSRRLNKKESDIFHSVEQESDEKSPSSLNTALKASCIAQFKENYVTGNPVEYNEQAHASAIIKLEANDEHISDENENNFLDSTCDVEFIENEPSLPIVVEDTEEEMETLVARMMDISGSGQNSIINSGLTDLCKRNTQLESELKSQTDLLESVNINNQETHNISDKLQLGLNTSNTARVKSSKESTKTTSARESFKRPLNNFVDLNEHPMGKKKKTKNEINIPKPKKKVPIMNKIIDGIVVPIIPQTTHSFRPLELVALSKGMTSTIQMKRSTELGASHLEKSQLKNDTEYIINDASRTEIIPPRQCRVSVLYALSGDETYFRDINIGETNIENLSISSRLDSFNDSASYHEESRQVENVKLYQHISDHSATWITFLKLNATPFELSYDSYLPLLNSMVLASVESRVLIRLNELFFCKIIGNRINVQFKWNFGNDNLLVAMLSALISTSATNEYKIGSFVYLCAFGQIIKQFRKYLKLNIRVERRHKDFLSNSSIDKTVFSKVLILEVIKFIELCKSFYDSM